MLVQQFFGVDKYAPFIESNFIPFKAMIGEETGEDLQERYGINSNPSVLLVQADGSLYDIINGYDGKPKGYIKRIQNSLGGIDTYVSVKKAYDENPNDLKAAYALADKHQRMWQGLQAITICIKILERPEEAKAITVAHRGKPINLYEISRYARAQGMYYENQSTAAMEDFRKEFPNSILIGDVFSDLANWYLRLPLSDQGKALYEEAAERYSQNPGIISGVIRYWTRTGDHFERGDVLTQKLISSDPGNWGFRQWAADFYLKHEKGDQALESYGEKYTRKILKNKNGLNAYAWFWAEKGKNLESALEMIRKAAVLEPKDDNLYDTMSMVYWKMKDHQKAVEAEEKALSMKPGNEDYLKRIADIKKDMTAEQP